MFMKCISNASSICELVAIPNWNIRANEYEQCVCEPYGRVFYGAGGMVSGAHLLAELLVSLSSPCWLAATRCPHITFEDSENRWKI